MSLLGGSKQPPGLLGRMSPLLTYAGLGLLSQGPSLTPQSGFQGLGQGLALGMDAMRQNRFMGLQERKFAAEEEERRMEAEAAATEARQAAARRAAQVDYLVGQGMDPTAAETLVSTGQGAEFIQPAKPWEGYKTVGSSLMEMTPEGPVKVAEGSPTTSVQVDMGKVPPGYELQTDATGSRTLVPIAGGEPARELAREKVMREGAAQYALDRAERVVNLIDEISPNVGVLTAGPVGELSKALPGSPAANLAANLNTIKANIGFEQLQQMRDMSKTGGALGQVSEMENRLLQAAYANVEQSQGPEQLRDNLGKLKAQVKKSWQRVRDAYEKDYGAEEAQRVFGVEGRRASGWTPQNVGQATTEELLDALGK